MQKHFDGFPVQCHGLFPMLLQLEMPDCMVQLVVRPKFLDGPTISILMSRLKVATSAMCWVSVKQVPP